MFAAAALTLGVQTGAKAQATRHHVVLEIGTGTWCQYCPGAALGADDLHADPNAHIGAIEHHEGSADPYKTNEGLARIGASYYNITGFPTSYFDGTDSIVGGNHTISMYPSYLQNYNAAMAVATPFDITATWTQNGSNIDVTAVVTQVGAYSLGNLRLQSCLTQSHIVYAWQGQPECNFVNRDMYPDENGQAVTVTQGNSQTFNYTIPINAAWNQSDMELIVWVENGVNKHIYNAAVSVLAVPTSAIDPSVVSIENSIGATSCISSIAPVVKIRNMGGNPLSSVDFSYSVNGGTASTYTWTGTALNFLDYATVTLPSINFTSAANNTLTVNITNSGDGNTANNVVNKTWMETNNSSTPGLYTFTLQQDQYGAETTWEIKDASGAIVLQGGPYQTLANGTPLPAPWVYTFTAASGSCYTFNIYDEYGDGICCSYGAGSYSLTNGSGNVVTSGGTFTTGNYYPWKTTGPTAVSGVVNNAINVYPNPSHGVFNVEIPNNVNAEISVMSLAGKLVYSSTTGESLVKMDLSDLASGMYMVRVKTAEGLSVKKITKE